ncbi:MAG: antitoxin [bacterium]|jgi:hypothetical protein
MSTLTIRGVDEEAFGQLKKQAKSNHSSVNKFVVEALRKIAFPGEPGKVREWHDLDVFFGSWSEEDAREVAAHCRECRKIDEELWK